MATSAFNCNHSNLWWRCSEVPMLQKTSNHMCGYSLMLHRIMTKSFLSLCCQFEVVFQIPICSRICLVADKQLVGFFCLVFLSGYEYFIEITKHDSSYCIVHFPNFDNADILFYNFSIAMMHWKLQN